MSGAEDTADAPSPAIAQSLGETFYLENPRYTPLSSTVKRKKRMSIMPEARLQHQPARTAVVPGEAAVLAPGTISAKHSRNSGANFLPSFPTNSSKASKQASG